MKDKTYTVNGEWKIEVDKYNHIPHRLVPEMKKEKGSKESTPTGEMVWKSENVFFPNIPQTMRYIIDKTIAEEDDVYTLDEYITRWEVLMKKLSEEFHSNN